MKRRVEAIENDTIKRMALVPGTTTKTVLTEVSSNIQSSSETKRILVTQATGGDMSGNSGRKSMSKDRTHRIKQVVQQYTTLAPKEFLTVIAHHISTS